MKFPALFVFPTVGAAAAAATGISLSYDYPNNLKSMEVYFYDKDSNGSSTTAERIKIYLEDLDKISKVQVYDNSDTKSKEEDKWKYISDFAKDKTKVIKYTNLYAIAKQFVQVQHNLNLVRSVSWNKDPIQEKFKGWLENTCKSTAASGKCKCDCSKSNTNCSTCLCCYGKKTGSSTGTDCCCKNGDTCDFTDLISNQKYFNFYLSNLYSANENVYLSPVQAHIKFTDATFDADFKYDESSTENPATNPTHKNIIGTLVYGFVDYSYKPTKFDGESFYKEMTGGSLKDSSATTSSNAETSYFANIPQAFEVTTKPGTDKNNSSAKWNNLEKIWKEIELKGKILEQSKKFSQRVSQSSSLSSCCCDSDTGNLECLIDKNFVFKESDLSKIQNKIKNSASCCTAQTT